MILDQYDDSKLWQSCLLLQHQTAKWVPKMKVDTEQRQAVHTNKITKRNIWLPLDYYLLP